jgi:hypothetical protein
VLSEKSVLPGTPRAVHPAEQVKKPASIVPRQNGEKITAVRTFKSASKKPQVKADGGTTTSAASAGAGVAVVSVANRVECGTD